MMILQHIERIPYLYFVFLFLEQFWLSFSLTNDIFNLYIIGKFRKEFKNTFTCQCLKQDKRPRAGTTYLCKYTSTVSHCEKRIHELANFTENKNQFWAYPSLNIYDISCNPTMLWWYEITLWIKCYF